MPSTTVAIIVTVFSILIQVWLITIKLELNISKLQRKTPALESIFNKVHEVSSLKACKLIKKLLQHRYFPWNFAKSLRTVFLKNASGGCLSYLAKHKQNSEKFFCLAYSSSCNLTPPISRVLICPQLIFCSLTSLTCCNSPLKCTPVKYKARQKAGFPTVT